MLNPNERRAISELKAILLKKYNLVELKLFGSKVKGVETKESDVDIFIVLEQYDWDIEKQIYELCFEIGLKYDVFLSPLLYSKEEIHDELIKATPFYQVVEKEGIAI